LAETVVTVVGLVGLDGLHHVRLILVALRCVPVQALGVVGRLDKAGLMGRMILVLVSQNLRVLVDAFGALIGGRML